MILGQQSVGARTAKLAEAKVLLEAQRAKQTPGELKSKFVEDQGHRIRHLEDQVRRLSYQLAESNKQHAGTDAFRPGVQQGIEQERARVAPAASGSKAGVSSYVKKVSAPAASNNITSPAATVIEISSDEDSDDERRIALARKEEKRARKEAKRARKAARAKDREEAENEARKSAGRPRMRPDARRRSAPERK